MTLVDSTVQVGSTARPKRLTVLGSTGSIGRSTLDLVGRNRDRFELVALVGHSNVDLLAEQARLFKPEVVVTADPDRYDALRESLSGLPCEVAAGREAVIEAASRPADQVMAAIVGAAGLEPTLAAVRSGTPVALANKECLVCAGGLFTREVERSGSTLLPVDSEHSAVFQVLNPDHAEQIDRIILTASGGPFRTWTAEQIAAATPARALMHPNWSMGPKITIDSATMMNKGLELIEAFHLFPVSADQLTVLVHPQSIIHSMVEYCDGSVLAQLGAPDMRTPIAYALAWPERMPGPAARLRLEELAQLTFEPVDEARFPAVTLCRDALATAGAAPTVLNAANEVAVHGFLNGQLGFTDIVRVVAQTLERAAGESMTAEPADLDEVLAADRYGRRVAAEIAAITIP